MAKKPTLLLILDGYGIAKNPEVSAIEGNNPYVKSLMENYPFAEGEASGFDVGLPEGQFGNSEVGHLNMGAGRVIDQPLVKITKGVRDGSFYDNKVLKEAMNHAKENNSNLHLYGLCSNGGVHSHIEHLYALLEMAKREGLEKVFVHVFLDGRDVPPKSGIDFIASLEDKIKEIGVGKIASIGGRYYVMDRDNRWDRVELAYNMMTLGEGKEDTSALNAISASYEEGVTDEFVVPTCIKENGEPVATINDNDAIIFYNFRSDRAREITRALLTDDFDGFERKKKVNNLYYALFCECDTTITNKKIVFPQEDTIDNTLSVYLSSLGLKQLHIAETEKYAHVTFFFNGGVEAQVEGEDRILVPSPKVATYDLQPEMSIYEVTDKLLAAIDEGKYDFIVCNFANGDMVGHTGIMEAAQKAVRCIDECVEKVVNKIKEVDGQMFLCADHGNCDIMVAEDGTPHTQHTTNKVPFVIINYDDSIKIKEGGKLGDIAPTILTMMGVPIPEGMSGNVLIEK